MTSVITIFLSKTSISIARIALKFATYLPRQCMRAARDIYASHRPACIQSLRLFRVQIINFILNLFRPQLVTLLKRVLECSNLLDERILSLLVALQEVGPVPKQNASGRRSLQLRASSLGIGSHRSGNRVSTASSSTAKPSPTTSFLTVHIPSHYQLTPPKTPENESNPSGFGFHTSCADNVGILSPAKTPRTRSTSRTSSTANLGVQGRFSIAAAKKPPVDDSLASFDRRDAFMSTLTLHEQIGEGAYGHIYRGSGCGGSLFAVKIMKREKTAAHDSLLRGEVDAMEQASRSVWAARLWYWQCSKDCLLITMASPFFTGGSIYDYAQDRRIVDADLSVFWTAEILLGLHSLHTLGIMHRDIKPENIMLTGPGHIRIIDFGLAVLFDHDAVSKERYPLFHSLREAGGDLFPQIWALPSNPHTTNEGLGTPGFSPPEVWLRKHYSYGIDYFAMACILYELLTDDLPYTYDPRAGDYDVLDVNVDRKHTLSDVQRDFLQKALMPNPVLRPSVAHMKKHPLFKNINWKALSRHEVPPPASFWNQAR